MSLTAEQVAGLNVAFNEATVLGFEVDPRRRLAGATFSVLTLPERGPAPDDRRVQIVLHPIGRVTASLRDGRWDDPTAEVVPFSLAELLPIVQSFGGLALYGWEFIDVPTAEWADRLSLDWPSGDDGLSHSITLFQDAGNRILYLCAWFDTLAIRDPRGGEIPLEAFIAGGKRWWDAFYADDERTRGFGLFPVRDPPG